MRDGFRVQDNDVYVYCDEGADSGAARPARINVVYLHVFDGDGQPVWQLCRQMGCPDFCLVAVAPRNWDDQMTPWPAPPVFRKGQPFGGHADRQLALLREQVMPQVEAMLAQRLAAQTANAPALASAARQVASEQFFLRTIAGYSLAGLFATWAAFNSDAFQQVASASGSLWYPGFVDYACQHPLAQSVERMYFSVGADEDKGKNHAMRTVRTATERIEAQVERLDVRSTFQLNPGNHFTDPDGRMARGICWVLGAKGHVGAGEDAGAGEAAGADADAGIAAGDDAGGFSC